MLEKADHNGGDLFLATMMSHCGVCGQTLSDSETTGGLCPRCLMEQAVDAMHLSERTDVRLQQAPPTVEQLRGKIPGLEITGIIGRGGMSAVYAARQVDLARNVAVKIMLGMDLSDPIRLARFQREAESLARLSHAGVVKVHSIGEMDGLAYLVLEHIDGDSLSGLLRFGALPISLSLSIALQITGALQSVHQAGVIHRDIKPSNVLLRRGVLKQDGMVQANDVVLADFGVAMLTDAVAGHAPDATLTAYQHTIGTPAYMAPEQHHPGSPMDLRCDIYAVGVLMYEMLAGRRPGRHQLHHHDIPQNVFDLIRRCLSERPQDRPENAHVLAQQIHAALEDVGLRGRTGRPMTFVAGFLVMALIGFTIGAWVFRSDPIDRSVVDLGSSKEAANSENSDSQIPENIMVKFSDISWTERSTGRWLLWMNYSFLDGEVASEACTYKLIIESADGGRIEQVWTGDRMVPFRKSTFMMSASLRPSDQEPFVAYLLEEKENGGQLRISPVVTLEAESL